MSFIDYFSLEHILNLSLFGVVILFWLILNNWINKNLERFLKQKGWLVEGREKNIKKLIKQVLLLLCSLIALESLTIGHQEFSISNITHMELFGFDFEAKADGSYDRFSFTIGSVFYLIFVIVISKISISIFRVLIYRSTKEKKWIDEGGTYTIVQLSKYVIYSIAGIVAIQGVGIDITFLIAGSAAIFVGIGFGLQSILGDVFSGIILLFDGSIKVGDVVEMPNQEICKINQIFIRTSQLKTLDGKTIIVPNGYLTRESVINWSISDKVTRFHISVGVAYGSDTQLVKEVLYQSALKHPLVEKRRNITIELEDFGDHALRFKLYFWAKQTWEIINIKSDIRLAIDQEFRKNEIKIPFPQRDLHLVSDSRKD
jgi:small-conductance mechanosensitive channel